MSSLALVAVGWLRLLTCGDAMDACAGIALIAVGHFVVAYVSGGR